jgi:hypothetical protein
MGVTNWESDIPTPSFFHLIFFGKEEKNRKHQTKMQMKKK